MGTNIIVQLVVSTGNGGTVPLGWTKDRMAIKAAIRGVMRTLDPKRPVIKENPRLARMVERERRFISETLEDHGYSVSQEAQK